MENKIIERVSDIPSDFILVTDYREIESVLESIAQELLSAEVGCLFVSIVDGEYNEVFYSERIVPYLNDRVYKIAT